MHKARFPFWMLLTICFVGCTHSSSSDSGSDNQPTPSADVWDIGALPEIKLAGNLQRTDVIPHLEGRITPGRNYLYCGTFKLVWQEYGLAAGVRDPQFGAAIDRLDFSEDDLSSDCYLVMTGSREEILAAMKAKFPNAEIEIPSTVDESGGTAFAYLQNALPFQEHFDRRPESLAFGAASGESNVACFGVEEFAESGVRDTLHRSQITIFDYRNEDDFVIRLNTMSADDEMILAKIPPQPTLGETIQSVQQRVIDGFKESDELSRLQDGESMIVPIVSVGVMRRFSELIPQNLSAAEASNWAASQIIRFRLDEKGAKLESYAFYDSLGGDDSPRQFIFDKPFLIYLVQKNSDHPYFAAWVENDEILEADK